MTDWTLRLFQDRLDSIGHAHVGLPPSERVLYSVDGSVTIQSEGSSVVLAPGEAWSGPDSVDIIAGSAPATLLRWELSNGEELDVDGAADGMLTAPITLPDASCLMRCDRVQFPPSGVAYLHKHRGPGIRCLLEGEITVTVKGESKTLGPMEAWFETGVDPVYAAASQTETTAFVRVMILPSAIQGQSSISYVNEEDRSKPKPQQYKVFVDRPLTALH